MEAQSSACSSGVNGRRDPGLVPNKYALGWVEINSFLPLALFSNSAENNPVCCLFYLQTWTSRAWSSPPARRTVWIVLATWRKRTTTASRAAPATPATQPHIPTDCSRTTVRHSVTIRLPASFLTCASLLSARLPPDRLPSPPTTYVRPVHNGGTPWTSSSFPGPEFPGSTWG